MSETAYQNPARTPSMYGVVRGGGHLPVAPLRATAEQEAELAKQERAVIALLGLDPSDVLLGSVEALALADGRVSVHWLGRKFVSREEFIAVAPDAPIV